MTIAWSEGNKMLMLAYVGTRADAILMAESIFKIK